jgi:pimeloyl-ACP methyl ester carboxylesterase
VTTDWTTETKGIGEYAEVNGINLYYETHGAGRPMILLHGGLGSGEMFGPTLPALAEHHQVIAVDLQGHGRTADIDRPIDIKLMADDIAALIDHLGLEKPDIVGYSLGGGVALFTAVKYPEKVGKLVSASANVRRDAIPPEMLAQQAQVNAEAVPFMKDTPMYQLYQRVAPHPEDFGRLLDKMGESMGKDFDFSEEVRGLQVPTLIVAADADMAPPRHYVEIFKLLDGRPPRRRLDGRRPAQGRTRARDPARPDPLQPRRLAPLRGGHPRLPRRSQRQLKPAQPATKPAARRHRTVLHPADLGRRCVIRGRARRLFRRAGRGRASLAGGTGASPCRAGGADRAEPPIDLIRDVTKRAPRSSKPAPAPPSGSTEDGGARRSQA